MLHLLLNSRVDTLYPDMTILSIGAHKDFQEKVGKIYNKGKINTNFFGKIPDVLQLFPDF